MGSWIYHTDEAVYERLVAPIWGFLSVVHPPVPSDVIFVFGHRSLELPRRAAGLYAAGWSTRLLVTGGFGPMSREVFSKAEALVFKDELLRLGIPESAITTEDIAGNILENVHFGVNALRVAGHQPQSALLVAKSFAMRRCLATFAQHYPDIDVCGCPPVESLVVQRDRPWPAFARRLLGELRRLDDYAAVGDITVQKIPSAVRGAAKRLQRFIQQQV
jgi:uncharacterized SAM-binding protein YcdF (DUF218 family)